MSGSSLPRRPGSSGGSSRSQQRPLKAVHHDFSQHTSSAQTSPAANAGTSGSDWNSSSVGKKRPSPSSSPFSLLVPQSPSPGSPSAAPCASKSNSSKRPSPGASPVSTSRQQQVVGMCDRELDAVTTSAMASGPELETSGGVVATSSWRATRPNSVDMMEGVASSSVDIFMTSFSGISSSAGSPGAGFRAPRASSRSSVGSVSSELETMALHTPSIETSDVASPPDGRRAPVFPSSIGRRETPPTLYSISSMSPGGTGSKSNALASSPSHSAARSGGTPRFSSSPQLLLSRRGSSDCESPSSAVLQPVAFITLMSSSPGSFDCSHIPEGATRIQTFAAAHDTGVNGDAAQHKGPDKSKVNITFSQSTVFQQCVPTGQS